MQIRGIKSVFYATLTAENARNLDKYRSPIL